MTTPEWARREPRDGPPVSYALSTPAWPVTRHHFPMITSGRSPYTCTPLDPSHHCSARCGTRDAPIEIDIDEDKSQAPGSPATATEEAEASSSSDSKRKTTNSDGRQSPQKKCVDDGTAQSALAQEIIDAAGDGQELSSSKDAPSSGELLPRQAASRAESPKQEQKKKPIICPIPGCFEKKETTFVRVQELRRHICTAIAHEDERSVPGWEKRWGIPPGYRGKIKSCPYLDCPKRGRAMRRNEYLDVHMREKHGIDSKEWSRRVSLLVRRMKKENRWTEEDAARKEWIYEKEIAEFVYRPGEELLGRKRRK